MKRFILSIAACAVITGCGVAGAPARARLDLQHPAPLKLKPIKWHVLEPTQATDKGGKPPIIALTEDDYKNLAENVRDITTFIKIQRFIIEKYKNYYEPSS